MTAVTAIKVVLSTNTKCSLQTKGRWGPGSKSDGASGTSVAQVAKVPQLVEDLNKCETEEEWP